MNPSVEMPNGERLLRIKEVAEFLRMSEKTVRRMIDAGQLASVKIRGLRLIRWSDLQKMLQPVTP
jgi:excisionase family DNA binding protein